MSTAVKLLINQDIYAQFIPGLNLNVMSPLCLMVFFLYLDHEGKYSYILNILNRGF